MQGASHQAIPWNVAGVFLHTLQLPGVLRSFYPLSVATCRAGVTFVVSELMILTYGRG